MTRDWLNELQESFEDAASVRCSRKRIVSDDDFMELPTQARQPRERAVRIGIDDMDANELREMKKRLSR